MRTGVLVIGHGSKLEHNRDLIVEMARILDERNEFGPAVAGFLEFNQPDIMGGIKALVTNGVETIYILPCFLASGVHLTEDIPNLLGLEKGRNGGRMTIEGKEITLRYCAPIGPDRRIADILSDRIRERAIRD